MLAALVITSFVTSFTGLSRYQFLAPLHFAALAWGETTAWIGWRLGRLPFIPELSSELVNTVVFFSVIGIPSGIVSSRLIYENILVQIGKWSSNPKTVKELAANFVLISVVVPFSLLRLIGAFSVPTVAFLISQVAFDPARPTTELDEIIDFDGDHYWTVRITITALILIPFLVSLYSLKGYAKGLFTIVSLLGALELLYWANAPGLPMWIDAYVCEFSDNPSSSCKTH